MIIPYVIDNQTHRMADVIKDILSSHSEKSLDIATAYFTVGGFGLPQAYQPGQSSLDSMLTLRYNEFICSLLDQPKGLRQGYLILGSVTSSSRG